MLTPKPKRKTNKTKTAFTVAAKLISDAKEKKKFEKDPVAYLKSKKLTEGDIIKASGKIKSLAGGQNASRNWW